VKTRQKTVTVRYTVGTCKVTARLRGKAAKRLINLFVQMGCKEEAGKGGGNG
jgi:hypothetical protein